MSESGWLARLKNGLSKTSAKLSDGITGVFTKRKLDHASREQLEELLLQADIGVKTTSKIMQAFTDQRFDKDACAEAIRETLAQEITRILQHVAQPLIIDATKKPNIILVVGVNGNGKTTTIGKLAYQLKHAHHKVMMAAADTFRAAAVEQLNVWAQRAGCELITGAAGGDAASVAYQAVEKAKSLGMDVLLIDSAGRLQNKSNLMDELQKIIKVVKKLDADAPHQVLLVLDATTGQNAMSQVETFKNMVGLSGLVITKLDGTAKGGIVVALADAFKLPVVAIGVGEAIEDLQDFSATDFARNLVGL